MKILLIHQYFLGKNEGGGSRFNEMTKIWAGEGHYITVLAGMVNYATGKKLEDYKRKFTVREKIAKNIEVIRCHVSESYNTNFVGRLWAYFSFVFSSLYAGLFKLGIKFDIIVITSPPLFVGITGVVLSRLKKVPFIFEVRDLWPESAIDTGVLTNKYLIRSSLWFENYIYQKASLINVLTPAFRDSLISQKHINPQKIIFIPNAADFTLAEKVAEKIDRHAVRKKLGFENKLVVIYVGAHGVANHLIQLIETAEMLKDEPILFISVGAGMQRPMLIEEALKRNLKNIKFLGPVSKEDIFSYILAADIGTSILKKVDTFKTVYSNKTFDYMACKKPVLMAIDGVSRTLVEDAECGFFVEPENPVEFSSKVKMYLSNRDLIVKHGKNGYEFAKNNFDRRKLALEYLNHFSHVSSY